uniref:Uncharacterized protein n=1 Tax=Arundo donax TaxID=35708 RepID=A0A0A9ABL9_ARUDO
MVCLAPVAASPLSPSWILATATSHLASTFLNTSCSMVCPCSNWAETQQSTGKRPCLLSTWSFQGCGMQVRTPVTPWVAPNHMQICH